MYIVLRIRIVQTVKYVTIPFSTLQYFKNRMIILFTNFLTKNIKIIYMNLYFNLTQYDIKN